MKEVTCVNPKCKASLVVTYQVQAGVMLSKPAWDTIECPKCAERFDIEPVPGTIIKVSVKAQPPVH